MKYRTIEDLHDKYIGHKKFAKFVDLAISKGHQFCDIKEYNEKFKFIMDGEPLEYDKHYKSTIEWLLHYCENLIKQSKELKRRLK